MKNNRRRSRSRMAGLEPLEARALFSGAPAAPIDLQGESNTPFSNVVTWTLNGGGETNVLVERWSGSAWVAVANLPAGTNVFFDNGLTPETQYAYEVVAVNGAGSTWAANYIVVKTEEREAPPPPTNLAATAISSRAIHLTWTLNGAEVAGVYVVRWTGAAWDLVATLGPGSDDYTDTGLTPQTAYFYDVVAFNDDGSALADHYAGATTRADATVAPAAPANLSATALSANAVNVTWSLDGTEDAVYVQKWNGAAWQMIAVLGAGATQFTDTGQSPATRYFYEVLAGNAFGSTWAASLASAVTYPALPPAAPVTLAADSPVPATAHVTWTLVDVPAAGHEAGLYVVKWNGAAWQIVAQLAAGTLGYTDTAVWRGGVFYYDVIAFNDFGQTWAAGYASVIVG